MKDTLISMVFGVLLTPPFMGGATSWKRRSSCATSVGQAALPLMRSHDSATLALIAACSDSDHSVNRTPMQLP